MASSALPHIKKNLPDSEVHFTTWAACRPLLELNPHVSLTKIGRIFPSKYDFLVDFRHEAKKPRFKGDDDPLMYWGAVHARQAADICGFSLGDVEIRPELYIAKKDRMDMSQYGPYVAINVWSQNGLNWRLWDHEKWVELVKGLQKKGFLVVQLGGKDDPQVDGVTFQLCGSTSLRQTISVVADADLVIGIDSFVMHCAHANIFCDGVKLGGPTQSILLAGPIPSRYVVPPDSPCSVVSNFPDCDGPCDHSFATPELPICEHGNSCMESISVEQVMEGLNV